MPIPSTVAPGENLGDVLKQRRYNKTKATQLLGMIFRSVRYRIKKLGIE